MNKAARRDAAEAREWRERQDEANDAAESYVADVEARAAVLEAAGETHDVAMQTAWREVVPADLRAELEELRAA